MPSEEIDSNAPIQHTSDGQNCDKDINQMKEEICSPRETMRNCMAKNVRPKGQDAITPLIELARKQQEIHPRRLVERSKGRKRLKTWDLQHTLNSHDFPKKYLIPSNLLSRSVWPRHDKRVQEIEELRSTTDLRQIMEARREISKLKGRLQENERKEKVNLGDFVKNSTMRRSKSKTLITLSPQPHSSMA